MGIYKLSKGFNMKDWRRELDYHRYRNSWMYQVEAGLVGCGVVGIMLIALVVTAQFFMFVFNISELTI